jgi:hypothetical protein
MLVTGSRLSHRPPRLAGPVGLGVGIGFAEDFEADELGRLADGEVAVSRLGAFEQPLSSTATAVAAAVSQRSGVRAERAATALTVAVRTQQAREANLPGLLTVLLALPGD